MQDSRLLKVSGSIPTKNVDAALFKTTFEAARLFHVKVTKGDVEQLVYAPLYEEPSAAASGAEGTAEAAQPLSAVDDPEQNKEAEEADHLDGFGDDVDQNDEAESADSDPPTVDD